MTTFPISFGNDDHRLARIVSMGDGPPVLQVCQMKGDCQLHAAFDYVPSEAWPVSLILDSLAQPMPCELMRKLVPESIGAIAKAAISQWREGFLLKSNDYDALFEHETVPPIRFAYDAIDGTRMAVIVAHNGDFRLGQGVGSDLDRPAFVNIGETGRIMGYGSLGLLFSGTGFKAHHLHVAGDEAQKLEGVLRKVGSKFTILDTHWRRAEKARSPARAEMSL